MSMLVARKRVHRTRVVLGLVFAFRLAGQVFAGTSL